MSVTPTVVCTLGFAYLCLVRALRWRRYNAIHTKFGPRYTTQTLTPEAAQQVMHLSSFWDMPMLMNYALAFALFKTYAIPSISKLLTETKELASKERVPKRYADTEIMLSTIVACPMSGFFEPLSKESSSKLRPDPRAMVALSRVNWLHSQHKIANDDFLYTLTLFILEPPRWAELYGWRPLSPLEQYSYYLYWAEIGRRMGIQDIPSSLEETKSWRDFYEKKHMLPAQTNHDIASLTMDELLHIVPAFFSFRTFARKLALCILEEPVRISMMQPAQPWFMHLIMGSLINLVSFIHYWLCLPRIHHGAVIDMEEPKVPADGSCPRLYPLKWQSRPWYKPQSTGLGYAWNRLSIWTGFYTEMPSLCLKSNGYRLEEMGPICMENSGREEVMRMAAELQGYPVIGTSYVPS